MRSLIMAGCRKRRARDVLIATLTGEWPCCRQTSEACGVVGLRDQNLDLYISSIEADVWLGRL
jgi:hypothetical protein